MPILVYFKTPPMSLLLSGNINKDYVRRLRKAVGNVVEMTKPDGQPIVIIGRADCDLSYVTEITQAEMDDMIKTGKAAAARGMEKKITPVTGRFPSPHGGKGFGGKH